MASTINNNPHSTNSEHQVLQEPVPTLPQKASTKVITQAIGEALPDAGVDTVVRLYAKTKLDGWEKRGIRDPQTRLTNKAEKFSAALSESRAAVTLTSNQAREKLGQAIKELMPQPVRELPPLKLMDTLLGDDPTWRETQHKRALALAAEGVAGLADIDATTSQSEVLARYRTRCSMQYTPAVAATSPQKASGGESLTAAFDTGLQKAEAVWAQIDRSKPLDLDRLKRILKAGQQGTLDHIDRGAAGAVEAAPRAFMQAYKLRKQIAAAHYKATTLQAADAVWFFFGRDPLTANPAELRLMQQHMLGLTAALAAVPGLDSLMPPATLLQLEEKVLDTSKTENIDRWTWVQEKLRSILQVLPLRIVEQGGFEKMCWTMMGTAAGRAPWLPEGISGDALDAETFRSLQIGLYFGMSYPFVDDMLDNADAAKTMGVDANSGCEKLEEMLWSGHLDLTSFPKVPALKLLSEAFNGLQTLLGEQSGPAFQRLAMMLRAQRHDAVAMRQPREADAESRRGYVTSMVKNYETSRATTKIFGAPDNQGDNLEMWSMFGQVLDDFIDVHEDSVSGNQTVFTQYMRDGQGENPLTALMHLVLELDARHAGTSARLFLGRRFVRALRRTAMFEGGKVVDDMLERMAPEGSPIRPMLLAITKDTSPLTDIDRRTVEKLKKASAQWSAAGRNIVTYMREHKPQVDALMKVPIDASSDPTTLPLTAGKSYVMSAGGKRLRPLLVMMVADGLGLNREHVGALSRAVEQLHSTSLVFDDLPAQDNADTRRGKLTTHTPSGSALVNNLASEALPGIDESSYSVPRPQAEARAQLTGLSLIGEAVQGVGELSKHFPADRTVSVIQYMGASVQRLSDGQMMDLLTPGRSANVVDVKYLERMAELKTGEAFDLSIRPVGILAGRPEHELDLMTQLANRLGVLYQVKDDILDVEGDAAETGKEVGIDARNGNKTFVTVLGLNGAKDVLARVSDEVTALLDELQGAGMRVSLLRDLAQLIIARKS